MVAVTGYMVISLVPKFLDLVKPLNDSRPQIPMYSTEFGVNSEKHFNSILAHSFVTSSLILLNFTSADMIFMACTQHASGIYAAIGYKTIALSCSFFQIKYLTNYSH